MGAALLAAGAAFGPTVVQAATAGLVRLEGGGSTHVAKVNSTGQLSVTDGTHHTKAGQLQVATAAPGQAVAEVFGLTCDPGGDYTVPAGKALIITGLTFLNEPVSETNVDGQVVEIGPAASPCQKQVAIGISSGVHTSVPQTFDPGIAVPAGDAVGGQRINDHGIVAMYGYLVPAADVPAGAVSGQRHGTSHGLGFLRH